MGSLSHADSFDALGGLQRDTGGGGQTIGYTNDANGNPLTLTDPLGRVTQQAFDPLNRLFRITDPGKGSTTTAFDTHDQPTSVTDPSGATTTYVYDGFGDAIESVSPDSGTAVYRYDLDGNLAQRVDAGGAIANYAFDALDRVVVAYTYDQSGYGFGAGRLTTVADAAGTLTRSYDERGNVLSETRANGAVTLVTTYTYDAASRIAC